MIQNTTVAQHPWLAVRYRNAEVRGCRYTEAKLLEPGWAGDLTDAEVTIIQDRLRNDGRLSFWWGFRPGMKSRPVTAIKRVAMDGDPENRAHNVSLVRRGTKEMPVTELKVDSTARRKEFQDPEPTLRPPGEPEEPLGACEIGSSEQLPLFVLGV